MKIRPITKPEQVDNLCDDLTALMHLYQNFNTNLVEIEKLEMKLGMIQTPIIIYSVFMQKDQMFQAQFLFGNRALGNLSTFIYDKDELIQFIAGSINRAKALRDTNADNYTDEYRKVYICNEGYNFEDKNHIIDLNNFTEIDVFDYLNNKLSLSVASVVTCNSTFISGIKPAI